MMPPRGPWQRVSVAEAAIQPQSWRSDPVVSRWVAEVTAKAGVAPGRSRSQPRQALSQYLTRWLKPWPRLPWPRLLSRRSKPRPIGLARGLVGACPNSIATGVASATYVQSAKQPLCNKITIPPRWGIFFVLVV